MDLHVTDPEFAERFEHFAFEEVPQETGARLDAPTRYMANLAMLLGCQGIDEYKALLPDALRAGLTPVMVKEIVYQAVDYLGIGRVLPFLSATNAILEEQGVPLPLPGQAATTMQNRLEKGLEAQASIFGAQVYEVWKRGTVERWLAENCFGDYYTRTGLELRQREMITFCFLAAQGGCEPQLESHIRGNLQVKNDRDFLTEVVLQNVPFIGYPRSLNALACIDRAAK